MNTWNSILKIISSSVLQFERALTDSINVQKNILEKLIDVNSETAFGLDHNFTTIRHYQDFSNQVPIRRYEEYSSYINAISKGHSNILTASPVIQFEPTGGSTAGCKLIPYTQDTLDAFQRAVLPWFGNLLQSRSAISRGRLFFIISPAHYEQYEIGCAIPIGSGNDLSYFGSELSTHLKNVTIWTPKLSNTQSTEEWKFNLSLLLLESDDLSFVSLWSPTLLLEVIKYIQNHKDELLSQIKCKKRKTSLNNAIHKDYFKGNEVWPLLDTISCWDSHTSAFYATQLNKYFSNIHIQGKGLLSTECIVTIPYSKCSSPVLAINSHFYEFLDVRGETHLSSEIEIGNTYRLIVTTQSGLYRYDTGDMLLVKGIINDVPELEFIGRGDIVSDICGEKITEAFAKNVIAKIDRRLVGQCFISLVNKDHPHYQVVTNEIMLEGNKDKFLEKFDAQLSTNPQYAYARKIGQLKPVSVKTVEDVNNYYQTEIVKKDARLSTLKLPALVV